MPIKCLLVGDIIDLGLAVCVGRGEDDLCRKGCDGIDLRDHGGRTEFKSHLFHRPVEELPTKV